LQKLARFVVVTPALSNTVRSGKTGSYDESVLLGSAGQATEKASL